MERRSSCCISPPFSNITNLLFITSQPSFCITMKIMSARDFEIKPQTEPQVQPIVKPPVEIHTSVESQPRSDLEASGTKAPSTLSSKLKIPFDRKSKETSQDIRQGGKLSKHNHSSSTDDNDD